MGDDPLSISWSKLSSHEFCRQQRYLRSTGHRGPLRDVRNFFHGIVCDRVMREWLLDPQPGQMPMMVDSFLDVCLDESKEQKSGVVRWRDPGDRARLTEWCRELLTRLEPILYRLVVPVSYESAKRFKVPIKVPYLTGEPTEIYLVGEMDILTRTLDDHWVVWDLKATEDNTYWKKMLGQLIFYSLAVRAMFDENTQMVGFIQPMCAQQVVGVTVSDDDRVEMLRRIIRMATDLWTHDYTVKEGTQGCTMCDVKHACPRYMSPGSLVGGGSDGFAGRRRSDIESKDRTSSEDATSS